MLLVKNKKALFDHSLIEKFTAGIMLHGHEVKAVREGHVSFEGSYVQVLQGEVFVINLYIGRYSKQSKDFNEQDSRRTRKLLLNKNEVLDITRYISEKGKTAVPLALIVDRGLIKAEIGVVKGRRDYEKKEVAKERQIKKDMERETKEFKLVHGK